MPPPPGSRFRNTPVARNRDLKVAGSTDPPQYHKELKADLKQECYHRDLPHNKRALKKELVARLESNDLGLTYQAAPTDPLPYDKQRKSDLLEECRNPELPCNRGSLKEDLVARLENDDLGLPFDPTDSLPYHKQSKADLQEECRNRGLPRIKGHMKEDLVTSLEDDDLDQLPDSPDMSRFQFFSLPPEIRCHIYDFVFESDQDVSVALDAGAIDPRFQEFPVVHQESYLMSGRVLGMSAIPLCRSNSSEFYSAEFPCRFEKLTYTRRFALLRVCKQIYHEARDRVYSAITVRFDVNASTFGDRKSIEAVRGPNEGFEFVGNSAKHFDAQNLVANLHRIVLKPYIVGEGLRWRLIDRTDPYYYDHSVFYDFNRRHIPAPIRIDQLKNVKLVVHLSKGYHHMDERGYWGPNPDTMAEPLTNVVDTFTTNVLSQAPTLQSLEVQIQDMHYPLFFCQEQNNMEKWYPVLKPLEALRGIKKVTTGGKIKGEFAEQFVKTLERSAPKTGKEGGEKTGEDSTLIGEASTFVEEGSTLSADDSARLEKNKAV
ncbi:MAG: hypothetical protein M1812_000543 [Candelaria pacifica]|nr:MAG: hypothetical protein M1812_000543 [Candelaria pacifica]